MNTAASLPAAAATDHQPPKDRHMTQLSKMIWNEDTSPMLTHLQTKPFTDRGASLELARRMYWWNLHMTEMQMPVLVYCVYRSSSEQSRLYAQGRTAPGVRVTNARAGQSAHNRTEKSAPASDAFDACPLIAGKPSWRTEGAELAIWQEMGHAAELLGLQWGKTFKSLGGDWAHFEYQRPALTSRSLKT